MFKSNKNKIIFAVIFFLGFFGLAGKSQAAPIISNVAVLNITLSSATVTWTTDMPATTQLQYGDGTSITDYNFEINTTKDMNLVTSHSVDLSGLMPGTIYNFRVRANDASNAWTTLAGGDMGCTFTTTAASGGNFDYFFAAEGPHHVVKGYNFHIALSILRISGSSDETVDISLVSPPTGVTSSPSAFVMPIRHYTAGSQLDFQTTSNTPAGTYIIQIQGNSRTSHVIHTINYSLTVEAVPTALSFMAPSSNPAIPRLSTWENHMKTYGTTYCNDTSMAAESHAWYYDGEKAYFNAKDYAAAQGWTSPYGSSDWETCAQNIESAYKTQCNGSNCSVPGYHVFPHGLAEDYLRNNDASSKSALATMQSQAAFVKDSGGRVLVRVSRETAYSLNAYVSNLRVSNTQSAYYSKAIDYALGHLDQWTVSEAVQRVPSFMVALTCEALIKYNSYNPDPRVPPAIQKAADWLWTHSWRPNDPGGEGFLYEANTEEPVTNFSDLDLLIAPIYGWLYKETGDPKYQVEGDAAFVGGVDHSYLGDGKHFSQNYRWSTDYVNWRNSVLVGPADTIPPASPSGLIVN